MQSDWNVLNYSMFFLERWGKMQLTEDFKKYYDWRLSTMVTTGHSKNYEMEAIVLNKFQLTT